MVDESLLVMGVSGTSAVRKESETFFVSDSRNWDSGLKSKVSESKGFATVRPHPKERSPNMIPIHLAGIPGYLQAGSRVFADGFKGGEAGWLGLAGFEDGEVSSRDADFIG